MARTFLGRWAWGLGAFGALMLLYAVVELASQRSKGLEFLLTGLPTFGLATAILLGMRWSDGRNKAIRLVLGANTVGQCDPAHLPLDVLEAMAGEPGVAHGTETFAEAARAHLRLRAYARAMWAARVCVALEDRAEGEALTDRILRDPEVVEAIEEVRRDARRWEPLLFAGEPAPQADRGPMDALPVEEDDRIRPS